MDKRVIDLKGYLDAKGPERGHFGVWGGEGARARFALPTWRAINLVSASRGGLVYAELDEESVLTGPNLTLVGDPDQPGQSSPRAFQPSEWAPVTYFVLDLGSDEPRTDFTRPTIPGPMADPPELYETEHDVVVHMCSSGQVHWYMVLDEIDREAGPLTQDQREQLLFFAGECAGLLLHRGLAAAEIGGVGASDPADAESGLRSIPDSGPSGA